MKTKQRNAEIQRKKQERLKAKEDEETKKSEINKAAKAEGKSKIELAKLQKLGKNQSKANETRLEKTVLEFISDLKLGCNGNDSSIKARSKIKKLWKKEKHSRTRKRCIRKKEKTNSISINFLFNNSNNRKKEEKMLELQ